MTALNDGWHDSYADDESENSENETTKSLIGELERRRIYDHQGGCIGYVIVEINDGSVVDVHDPSAGDPDAIPPEDIGSDKVFYAAVEGDLNFIKQRVMEWVAGFDIRNIRLDYIKPDDRVSVGIGEAVNGVMTYNDLVDLVNTFFSFNDFGNNTALIRENVPAGP